MTDVNAFFRGRRPEWERLADFGFQAAEGTYILERALPNGLVLKVTVMPSGQVCSTVTDPETGEAYTLHLVKDAVGGFVGQVRQAHEELLGELAETCFVPDVFQMTQTQRLMTHVETAYGDRLEFLWPKSPGNAIWRRSDNQKWYAALLTLSARKLGLSEDVPVEIVNLRVEPEVLTALIDGERYFPGFHMNKRHWYTIILDDRLPDGELYRRLADSYALAADKSCR